MAFEAARILHHLGCEVRMYDPTGLPVKDDVQHSHPKVQELRQLSEWSEAQFWCSPEQHGNITAVLKNQSELARKGMAVADDADGYLFWPRSRLDTTFDWIGAAHPRQNLSVCAGE
jgi:NAD(P)H-dependent FMN reductase